MMSTSMAESPQGHSSSESRSPLNTDADSTDGEDAKAVGDGISPWQHITTVLVGPHETKFIVHKHILCQVPFFEVCLNSNMWEAKENVVKLPEDTPAGFDLVVKWLYKGCFGLDLGPELRKHAVSSVVGPGEFKSAANAIVRSAMVDAYVMADKFCMEELKNFAIDRIHESTALQRDDGRRAICLPGFELFKLVVDTYDSEDGLYRLFAELLAAFVHGLNNWETFKSGNPKFMEDFLTKYTKYSMFLIDALKTYPAGSFGDLFNKSSCRWHVHDETSKCNKEPEPVTKDN